MMFGRTPTPKTPRHECSWIEVGRNYNAGGPPGAKMTGGNTESRDRFMYGFTVIELQCLGCKSLDHHTVIGKIGVE